MPHDHDIKRASGDLFYFQLNLCFSVFILLVQLAGGIYSGSWALIADTGHVAIHGATEVVVILAIWTGSKKADKFGSWLITALLFFLVAGLIWGAYQRYLEPNGIEAPIMFAATLIGLLGNTVQRFVVRNRGLGSISASKYKLCLDTDIYSSIGVLIGAVAIYFNPTWLIVDTAIAFAIAGWVVWKVIKMSRTHSCD
ncbi:MAG: cation transporter [Patescibacteria group bacterium]